MTQCDQMGDFLKLSVTNLLTKVGQIFPQFWGYFEKNYILVKKRLWLRFGQLLEVFGLLFISTSGHTAAVSQKGTERLRLTLRHGKTFWIEKRGIEIVKEQT